MILSPATRIGVLLGGMSTERAISLKTGKAVHAALVARGWNAVTIDVGPDLPERLRAERIEVAWIALHGQFGEDGAVQGLLEILRIPYTGSSVQASAICMDKVATKRMLAGMVPMARDVVWQAGEAPPEHLLFPVFAKTPHGGSTLGVQRCLTREALQAALEGLVGFGPEVLIEEEVAGPEITVAVLDGVALPVVGIAPVDGFFDYAAKYTAGATRYEVPSSQPEAVQEAAKAYAERVYRTLRLSGVARADFIVCDDGTPVFLEVNTLPGMTATSLSPMAASVVGISFEELCERILRGARLHLERREG